MKRSLLAALAALCVSTSLAQAGGNSSWLFKPSYYSHNPVRTVQIGRQNAGGPVFTRPTGDYYQVGARYMNSTIRVGPYTWDSLRVMESWTQSGSQY